MDADGVGLHGDQLARCRLDGAFLHGAHHARHGEVLVVDDGVGKLARHQQPLVGVVAVGEELLRGADALRLARADELAVRKAHQHQVQVGVVHGGGHGTGKLRVHGGAVVQLAVRLHVVHARAGGMAEGLQRADLVQDVVVGLVGRHGDVAAAEALQVGIARVGAHGHARVGGELDGAAHDRRVAGVHAARHVDAGNQRDDLIVKPERVSPEAFPQVGVEIDARHVQTLPFPYT